MLSALRNLFSARPRSHPITEFATAHCPALERLPLDAKVDLSRLVLAERDAWKTPKDFLQVLEHSPLVPGREVILLMAEQRSYHRDTSIHIDPDGGFSSGGSGAEVTVEVFYRCRRFPRALASALPSLIGNRRDESFEPEPSRDESQWSDGRYFTVIESPSEENFPRTDRNILSFRYLHQRLASEGWRHPLLP